MHVSCMGDFYFCPSSLPHPNPFLHSTLFPNLRPVSVDFAQKKGYPKGSRIIAQSRGSIGFFLLRLLCAAPIHQQMEGNQ